MGIVHSGFGVGSTLGPLFVTVLLALGGSWRIAFGALAVADLMLAVAFIATVSAIEPNDGRVGRRPSIGEQPPHSDALDDRLLPVCRRGRRHRCMGLQPAHRGTGDRTGVAGMAVAAYWGGMTAARVALGVFGDRVDPNRVLTASGIGTVACLVLLWVAPTPWLGIVGLVASGFAHGSVFPLEVLLTPGRFGDEFTPWAVGYEIAGANIGVAVLSGAIGILVGRVGSRGRRSGAGGPRRPAVGDDRDSCGPIDAAV